MRVQTGMPAHGIGVSNPHMTRYVILAETKDSAAHYRFRVQFFSQYTGSPEVADSVETYVVQAQKDDTGNEAWLITDVQR